MKKLLMTSTALVAGTGIAFADGHTGVSLTGYAEIGLSYFEDRGALENEEFKFHSDMDVIFKGSGETDGGITFGFSIDLDEVDNGISNFGSDGAVFISGTFGTISLGDTDGAFDKALAEVGALTSLTDDHTTHAGYSFNGGRGNSEGFDASIEGATSAGYLLGNSDGNGYEEEFVLRYDYSFGDFDLAFSVEQGGDFEFTSTATTTTTIGGITVTTTATTVTATEEIDATYGIGFAYDADLGGYGVRLGVGYETNDDIGDVLGGSLTVSVDAFTVGLNYSSTDLESVVGEDYTHFGIGATYAVDALSIHANYGMYDIDDTDDDVSGYGIAVNYDLGGGAVVMFGYGNSMFDDDDTDDVSTASFGLGLTI